MKTGLNAQRGVSLSGFAGVAVIIILVAIMAAKTVPSYLESRTIKSEFEAILSAPEMKTASEHDIRMAFSKRAGVSNIKSINQSDIEVLKEGSVVTLSVSYVVKVPLAGNASLLLEFNPTVSSR